MLLKNDPGPGPDPSPAEDRLMRRQFRHEEASVRETLRLLRAARRDARDRIRKLPSSLQLGTVLQMEHALTQAIDEYIGRWSDLLKNETGTAVEMGIALAEVSLPASPVRFALSRELIDNLHSYHLALAGDVRDDTLGAIKEILQRGLLSGASTEDLAREVGATGLRPVGPFKTVAQRSEAIVRTELNKAANMASYARYQDAAAEVPGMVKTWRSAGDFRVRDSHRVLNGVTIPMGEKFSVGGTLANFPHDPVLPAAQVVHCRCRVTCRVREA